MTESNDLKPGAIAKMNIGNETLILEPIPYGRLKKLMSVIFAAMDKFAKMDSKNVFLALPSVFEENLPIIIPLIFDERKHQFLNQQWVDDNLTLVHMREIVDKTIQINGLRDFLGQMGAAKNPTPREVIVPEKDKSL